MPGRGNGKCITHKDPFCFSWQDSALYRGEYPGNVGTALSEVLVFKLHRTESDIDDNYIP